MPSAKTYEELIIPPALSSQAGTGGTGPDRDFRNRTGFGNRNRIATRPGPDRTGSDFPPGPGLDRISARSMLASSLEPDRTGPDFLGNRTGPDFWNRIFLEPDRTEPDRNIPALARIRRAFKLV